MVYTAFHPEQLDPEQDVLDRAGAVISFSLSLRNGVAARDSCTWSSLQKKSEEFEKIKLMVM